MTAQAQAPARIDIDHDYVNIINGRPVTSEQTAPVYNPATGEVIAQVPVATKEQLDQALAAARTAFPAW